MHLGNAESSTTRVGRPRERGEMCVHGPNVVERRGIEGLGGCGWSLGRRVFGVFGEEKHDNSS